MHSVMQCILLNGWNIWPWWLMKTQRVVHCPVEIKSVSVVSVFCPGPPVASLVNILVSITHWHWDGGALFLPVLSKNPWNCHAFKNSSIFYWAKFDWSWERWNVKVWQFSTSEWQKIWTRVNGIVVQSLNKNQLKHPSSLFPLLKAPYIQVDHIHLSKVLGCCREMINWLRCMFFPGKDTFWDICQNGHNHLHATKCKKSTTKQLHLFSCVCKLMDTLWTDVFRELPT